MIYGTIWTHPEIFKRLFPKTSTKHPEPAKQVDVVPEWITGALLMSLATYSTIVAAVNALLVTPETLTQLNQILNS